MTKDELKNLRYINFKIDSKIRQLEDLKLKKYLVKSLDYSKDKIQNDTQANTSESLINKLIDLEKEINEDIDYLVGLKTKAKVEIDSIGGVFGTILSMRYLECMEWEKISDELKYSYKHIFKIHNKALRLISKKEDTK